MALKKRVPYKGYTFYLISTDYPNYYIVDATIDGINYRESFECTSESHKERLMKNCFDFIVQSYGRHLNG